MNVLHKGLILQDWVFILGMNSNFFICKHIFICNFTGAGCPVGDKTNSMTVGPRGPILLQDHVLIDELAHFDRERIPERVVHAKGAGAFGYFEVTHDITKYCKVQKYG